LIFTGNTGTDALTATGNIGTDALTATGNTGTDALIVTGNTGTDVLMPHVSLGCMFCLPGNRWNSGYSQKQPLLFIKNWWKMPFASHGILFSKLKALIYIQFSGQVVYFIYPHSQWTPLLEGFSQHQINLSPYFYTLIFPPWNIKVVCTESYDK
jgi:hypothetical protein